MDRSITSAGLMLGLAIGFSLGYAVAVARRAWADYRKTKAAVPGLRKDAWSLIGWALTKGGLVTLLIVAAVAWAAIGPE